jgi:hypothetical protein
LDRIAVRSRYDLENLLVAGLASGASKRMSAARKKQIYKHALKAS